MILQTTNELKQKIAIETKSHLIERVFNEIDTNYNNDTDILSISECTSHTEKLYRVEKVERETLDKIEIGYYLHDIDTHETKCVITEKECESIVPKQTTILDEILEDLNDEDYNACYFVNMLKETEYLEEKIKAEKEKIVNTITNLDHDRLTDIQEQYYKIRKIEEELERMRNTVIPMLLLTTSCIIIYLLFKFLR